MTTRSIIRDLIVADSQITDLIEEEKWKSSGGLTAENAPDRPFGVLRYGVQNVGLEKTDVWRQPLTIWVHDEVLTYTKINSVLDRLKAILDGVEQRKDADGNEIWEIRWTANSGDLYDPGFRTLTRNATFNIVGKGV